jgi:hypothetical protein
MKPVFWKVYLIYCGINFSSFIRNENRYYKIGTYHDISRGYIYDVGYVYDPSIP